jgi:transposase
MKNHFNIRLTEKQRKHLKKIYKTEKGRASERAHVVLLYMEDYSISEIATICLCDRNTVSAVLKRFEERRFEGLYDQERSGAPRTLNQEDEAYLFYCLRKSPIEFGYYTTVWTVSLMIYHLHKRRNKDISESALKDFLDNHSWRFKRPKHIPPDGEPLKEEEKREILRLLDNPNEDEIILFGDESEIELLPYISGAWMPEGEQLEIPTPGKNKILCIFGFFNPHTKEFIYKMVVSRKNKTAKNFIVILHQIRQLFRGKKIHIIIDNSSIHSEKTKLLKRFRELHAEEVIIHFLPKRAPILNPIERFWQFLKKRISCNWLYGSLDELKSAFRRFIWQYREGHIEYNFTLKKLIRIWEKYPTAAELQIQNQNEQHQNAA